MSKILGYTSVLTVGDLQESIAFFVEKMGFVLDDSYGNPMYYANLSRDNSGGISLLHDKNFSLKNDVVATLAFQCLEIDSLYQEYLERGIVMEGEIGDKEYGKREFSFKDPNDYVFFFQQDIE